MGISMVCKKSERLCCRYDYFIVWITVNKTFIFSQSHFFPVHEWWNKIKQKPNKFLCVYFNLPEIFVLFLLLLLEVLPRKLVLELFTVGITPFVSIFGLQKAFLLAGYSVTYSSRWKKVGQWVLWASWWLIYSTDSFKTLIQKREYCVVVFGFGNPTADSALTSWNYFRWLSIFASRVSKVRYSCNITRKIQLMAMN